MSLGYLKASQVDSSYGTLTIDAVTRYQTAIGVKATGVADMATQQRLDHDLAEARYEAPETLIVVDEDEEDE